MAGGDDKGNLVSISRSPGKSATQDSLSTIEMTDLRPRTKKDIPGQREASQGISVGKSSGHLRKGDAPYSILPTPRCWCEISNDVFWRSEAHRFDINSLRCDQLPVIIGFQFSGVLTFGIRIKKLWTEEAVVP